MLFIISYSSCWLKTQEDIYNILTIFPHMSMRRVFITLSLSFPHVCDKSHLIFRYRTRGDRGGYTAIVRDRWLAFYRVSWRWGCLSDCQRTPPVSSTLSTRQQFCNDSVREHMSYCIYHRANKRERERERERDRESEIEREREKRKKKKK